MQSTDQQDQTNTLNFTPSKLAATNKFGFDIVICKDQTKH